MNHIPGVEQYQDNDCGQQQSLEIPASPKKVVSMQLSKSFLNKKLTATTITNCRFPIWARTPNKMFFARDNAEWPILTENLDLNNPVFQRQLFNLTKRDQRNILNTLRKLAKMTWQQVYSDFGLKWEVILSQKGPGDNKLYSFRISKGFRGVTYREGAWLRLLSLHPDHDSAYQ